MSDYRAMLADRRSEAEQGRGPAFAEDDRIGLDQLWRIVRGGRLVILGAFLLALLVGGLYVALAPPVYEATARLILDTRQKRLTDSEMVVSNLEVSTQVVAGEVESIRSNVLVGKVVDRLGLTAEPEFSPPEGQGTAWSDAERRRFAIDRVQKQLGVSQVGISYAIEIHFRAHDPVLAARVANALAEEYIQETISAKREATRQATALLEERIAELSRQVEAADEAVVEYRKSLIAEVGSDKAGTGQLMAELNSALVAATSQRADAEARFATVRQLFEQGGLSAIRNVLTSPLLERLAPLRAELAGEMAQRAITLGPRHPEMVRLSAQLADLDRAIDAELSRRMEEMRSEIDALARRETELRAQIARAEARQAEYDRRAVRLSQLERTADATRLVYEDFLSRFKEISGQIEFQPAEARQIAVAAVPQEPAAPRKAIVMAMAGAFGLSAGIAVVFIRAATQRPITSAGALARITRRPVLAVLPYLERALRLVPFARPRIRPESQAAFNEGIRTLRTRLFANRSMATPKVLMISSALPGEGKSTVAVALAASLRDVSQSVLLIDADLRRSRLRRTLALERTDACLVDYLENGRRATKSLVQTSAEPAIDIIAPMRLTDQAADLLASENFRSLVTFMSLRYDVIIIDAPPVVNISDALTLAPHADATMLVVRANHTNASLVEAATARLEDAGAVVVGSVLSQVRRNDATDSELYGYSYYY
ncbi:MAG: polysaccharide biosynthesis tyrosine autokinase [Alphaproteobacteria bacterium]|nr:MAG: polysaccharide biosynthesis tyrosine autokinase [Alphaproteobacteria bacterium]